MLTILVSTSNERLLDLRIPPLVMGFKCFVVHQVYNHALAATSFDEFLIDKDFGYKRLDYPGLSKSRNCALSNVETKYAFIMDDDVEFDVEKMQFLISWMEANEVDVATCQHQFENGAFPKKYKPDSFRHNLLSVAKVSSIDICINIESLRKAGVCFDERFGLGTELPSGEEYIFLADCLRHGLDVRYYPITIGVHPAVTSGMDFYSSSNKVLAKREMLKRVFGWSSVFFIFAFWLKKVPAVIMVGYFLSFTKTMIFGVKDKNKARVNS